MGQVVSIQSPSTRTTQVAVVKEEVRMEHHHSKKSLRLWGKTDRDVDKVFTYQTSLFSSSFAKPINDLLHRHYYPAISHSEFRLSPVSKINISAVFDYALMNQAQSVGAAFVSFEDTRLTILGKLSTGTGGRTNVLTKYRLFRRDLHEREPVKHSFFDVWANLDNENVNPNLVNQRFIDVQNLRLGITGRKYFSAQKLNFGGDLWYNFRSHCVGGSTILSHYLSQKTSVGCEYEVSPNLDLTKFNVVLSLSDSKKRLRPAKNIPDRTKSSVRIIEEGSHPSNSNPLDSINEDWHKPDFYDLSFKVMDFGRRFSASYYHQMRFKSWNSVTRQNDFWGNSKTYYDQSTDEGYLVTLGGEFEHDESQLNLPPINKLTVGGEWQLGRDVMVKGKMATDGRLDLGVGGRLRIFPMITGTLNYSTNIITNNPNGSFGFSLIVED
eukprot:TRINITY_DN19050_c0_g1_i1.p1 TRINITY_DN19050_c0_g1~~TRINITY_DN19050_c0_g1_i1.p1  ORF type:complete len:438 (-),score=91.73 TRINITY_DN19050_c0_g1_i1:10-1323(-)